MDDRIALMDQGSLLGLRALGHQPCFHATWTYARPVDLDALSRFNENLAHTLLGRLVERSPLPGGRHRWVALDSVPDIEIETAPRERAGILGWTDEFGDRGTDPEHGPGWRIGVLPLVDGGSAVTIIIPHTLGDGLCVLEAIADAVAGRNRRPNYPRRGALRRSQVLRGDLAGFARELPAVCRAAPAAIRVAKAQGSVKPKPRSPAVTTPIATIDGPFRVPYACVRVSHSDWDAAAAQRGGTPNTLVAAVAARLGEVLGRTDSLGNVTLAVPVSVRTEGDTRANALEAATIRVNPVGLADDLTDLRAATKAALTATASQSADVTAALGLTPLLPKALVRRGEAMAMGASTSPVGCSNYGDLPGEVARIDGVDPDDFWVRLNEPGMGPGDLDRIGGQLYVLSGRANDAVFLSVVAHPVGGGLDNHELHRLVASTLAEFDLAPLPNSAAPHRAQEGHG